MDMDYTPTFENFSETERGNTYLVSDDGTNHLVIIGLRVEEDDCEMSQFLQISIIPENYPAVNVDEITIYLKDLANDIKEFNDGWYVRKWNLPFEAPVDESGCIDSNIEIDWDNEE